MAIKKVERGYWTQTEVAEHFRVSKSTVKNWRDKGYLPYFQLPDSTRVLYPDEGIKELSRRFTHTEKEVLPLKTSNCIEIMRKKPVVSVNHNDDWRI